MEKLAGYVEHIIYRNTDNGYTVLNLVSGEDEITCVGIFSTIAEGENIEATGDYTDHPTYGTQFKVVSFEEKAPEDQEAIERYLGSGAIKGIGLAMAARIVRRFREDTFRIIEEEPERLAEVKGISERKAMEIASQVNEKRDLRQAMIFLQQFGITMNLAVKIYNKYGQEVYGILKENPYRLADDIEGVGFRTADDIAAKAGIRTDSDFRVRSGILYTLLQASGEGHTFLPQEELTAKTSELLGIDKDIIEKNYMDLSIERKIIMKQSGEQTQIYSASFYYMEANTATMLRELDIAYDVADAEIEQRIHNIEKQTGMQLDEHQVQAVKEAVRNGLLVITGGPGTGKTTTINTIIRYFEMEGMDIFLAAPTGRAAKRMSETTGFEARTIHRMLELNGGMEGSAGFERNETNPLETDLVIIDEMDEGYRKKQKNKLKVFFITACSAVFFLIAGCVCTGMRVHVNNSDYDNNIKQAELSATDEEKIDYYAKAIDILPGNSEAYFGIIEAFKDDAVFSLEEEELFKKKINSNLTVLQQNSDYGDLAFEIGKLYWYYYDYGKTENSDNQITRMKSAIQWFEAACTYGGEDSSYYTMAEMYRDIGQFNRDITLNVQEASDKGTYLPYWENITKLVATVSESQDENEIVNLEVYKLAMNAVETYARKFKADDVAQEDMKALLEQVKAGTEQVDTTTDKTEEMKNDILKRLQDAEAAVKNAYAKDTEVKAS
jgi:ribosomal protein S13/DNA polymerase III delta prime subunit